MEKNTYSVYQHIFPNGMIYTGLTSLIPVKRRFGKNGSRYCGNKNLYNEILKYGWDNIEHSIVKSNLTKQEAQDLEKKLIAENKKNGVSYNINKGGDIGGDPFIYYNYNGENLTLKEIYDKYNQSNASLEDFYSRITKQWDIDRALKQNKGIKNQPHGVGEKKYEYNGEKLNSYDLWCIRKNKNLLQFEIVNRINHHGWSVEDAITKPLKGHNILYKYHGKEYNTSELASIFPENNLENHDITDRLRAGWSVEKAVETPKAKQKVYFYNGEYMSLSKIYSLFQEPKIGYTTFWKRVKNGMSFEDAIKVN